mmetsp:Transcript_44192/g.59909  ORF Transcript_44192/g.59909 Transcript_44192/m.59909 type:complete len:86 (+) Transcript_44192:346-603(+)
MSLALGLLVGIVFLYDISSFLNQSKTLFVKLLFRLLNNLEVLSLNFTDSYIVMCLTTIVVQLNHLLTLLQALLGSNFVSLDEFTG